MLKKLLAHVVASTLGLLLAYLFVPGVKIILYADSSFLGAPVTGNWQIFVVLGIIIGLINLFVKPILDTITLPLRIVTLGIFSFVVNMGLLWAVDVMFRELFIPLWLPLFYTSLIMWAVTIVISNFLVNKKDY